MGITIQKLFARLLCWLYELLDTIFDMFQLLSGVQSITINDGNAAEEASGSLINIFLTSSTVTRAFLLICIVAVFVAAVSVIAAIVKNIINAQVDFTDRAPAKVE